MKRNVGSIDRMLRAVGGVALAALAFVVTLPPALQVLAVAQGGYLVLTALAGYCVGYRLLGRSTCALPARR